MVRHNINFLCCLRYEALSKIIPIGKNMKISFMFSAGKPTSRTKRFHVRSERDKSKCCQNIASRTSEIVSRRKFYRRKTKRVEVRLFENMLTLTTTKKGPCLRKESKYCRPHFKCDCLKICSPYTLTTRQKGPCSEGGVVLRR